MVLQYSIRMTIDDRMGIRVPGTPDVSLLCGSIICQHLYPTLPLHYLRCVESVLPYNHPSRLWGAIGSV